MRIAWYITGLLVLAATITLGVREYYERADRARFTRLVDDMLAKLQDDPRARKPETRAVVERVAALAEHGAANHAEAHFALGMRRHGQKQYIAAETAYREAIALKPDWSWPYTGLGITLYILEQPDEAEKAFRRAIELDPTFSRPHDDLAILLRKLGRFLEAEKESLAALRLEPNSVASHNNYGNLLVAMGRLAAAEKEYVESMRLDPSHPSPKYNMACLKSRLGHLEEALTYFEQAIRLEPTFRDEALEDTDLDSIRGDPRFAKILSSAK